MTDPQKGTRLLAIYPHRRGLSYVLLGEDWRLYTFGRRWIEGEKARRTAKALRQLIQRFRPSDVVLEDPLDPGSLRRLPMKRLLKRLAGDADRSRAKLQLVTRANASYAFRGRDARTKDDRAMLVAQLYPVLQRRLPPRREVWMAESECMGVFDAMTLALAHLGVPEQPPHDELKRYRQLLT